MPDENISLPEWAKGQPNWQQHALKKLAEVGSIQSLGLKGAEEFKKELKKILSAEVNGENIEFNSIAEADIPNTTEEESQTYLKSLGPVKNIDKLESGQKPFRFIGSNGLNVIFGHNGSGKSGYARILRYLCRSHGEAQLPIGDATREANSKWEVKISCTIKNFDSTESDISATWEEKEEKESRLPLECLRRVAFFDDNAVNTYLNKKRELFYVPPEIRLYDELGDLAEEFERERKDKVNSLETSLGNLPDIPEVKEGTSAHNIASKFNHHNIQDLSDEDFSLVCTLSDAEEKELIILRKKQNQPQLRRNILKNIKDTLDGLEKEFSETKSTFSEQSLADLCDKHATYKAAEAKSADRGAELTTEEFAPVEESVRKHIGSAIWIKMYRAAIEFTNLVTETTRTLLADRDSCPLCHQALEEEAKKRLKKFDELIQDDFAEKLDQERSKFEQSKQKIISQKVISSTEIEQRFQLLEEKLDAEDKKILAMVAETKIATLEIAKGIETRKSEIINILKNEESIEGLRELQNQELPAEEILKTSAMTINSQWEVLDKRITNGEEVLIEAEQKRFDELECKEKFHNQKSNLENRIRYLKQLKHLYACKDSLRSSPITAQSKRRANELISDELKMRYKEEIEKLDLRYLGILPDIKGERGASRFEIGMDIKRTGIKISDILSEGEQRAVALAGFFTEVNEREAGHAIILDDPVSSLDLQRQELIARRLVEEAKQRQVIVFTHNYSFATQLKELSSGTSDEAEVAFEQHWIGRGINELSGVVGKKATAWDFKTVYKRCKIIEKEITNLKDLRTKIRAGEIPHEDIAQKFELRLMGLANQLRQTWERAVEELAFNNTIRRFELNIKSANLAEVNFTGSKDHPPFDEGIREAHKLMHDRPVALGIADPFKILDQLESNYEKLSRWTERFKNEKKKEKESIEEVENKEKEICNC